MSGTTTLSSPSFINRVIPPSWPQIGLIATSPWNTEDGFSWTMWYLALVDGLMLGLIALILQHSFAESRLANHLQQGPLDFDIFLHPLSQLSGCTALTWLFASILLPILVTLGQRLLAYVLVELGIN